MKKAYNVISTYGKTPWYNETNGKGKPKIEVDDINIEQPPIIPIWKESSLNNTELADLKLNDINFSDTDISFSSIHMFEDGNYKTNGSRLPGVYYEISNTVALVVRLKLDRIVEPDICNNAIAYSAYPTDSSNNLILSNAYQFNYNTKVNEVDSGGSTIPVFKPYHYTLEDGNFSDVSRNYWLFDTANGIITFQQDPKDISTIDDSQFYFTFVKYIGLTGLDNLLYKLGIDTNSPNNDLDVSGSVNVSENLSIRNSLDTDTLYVDSLNKHIGIRTVPTDDFTLDVSGSVTINGELTVDSGIGPGFYPIGAIIMWPTNDLDSATWIRCDGRGISSSAYPELAIVFGIVSGEIIFIPDFEDNYIKMGGETDIRYSGSNTSSYTLQVNNLPQHDHNSSHTHVVETQSHRHSIPDHGHSISLGNHTHELPSHTHSIQDSGHTHTCNNHNHNVNDIQHSHEFENTAKAHTHGVNAKVANYNSTQHDHQLTKRSVLDINIRKGNDGNSNVADIHINYPDTANNYRDTANYDVNSASGNVKNSNSSVAYAKDIVTIQSATPSIQNVTDSSNTITIQNAGGTTTTNSGSGISFVSHTGSSQVLTSNSNSGASIGSSVTEHSTNSTEWHTVDPITITIEPEYTTAFYFIRAK